MGGGMNSGSALGFGMMGGMMRYLPVWFPSMLGPASAESVRAIWLLFMSTVLISISAGYYVSIVWRTRGVWTGWILHPIAGVLAARRQGPATPSVVQTSSARASV